MPAAGLRMNAPSTFTVAILAIIANGALLFMIRGQLAAHTTSAARAWLYGTVAIVIGILSYLVPGVMPPGLELALPNGLILGGMLSYNVALRLYHQLPVPRSLMAAVLALVVAGVLVFQWGVPDVRVRVFIVSLSWLWIMGDSLLVLHRGRKISPSPARTGLTWLYALVFTGTALRLAYFLLSPVSPTLSVTDGTDWVNRMTPILAILLPAAGSSAFMLMCYHHQYHMVREQAVTDPLTNLGNRMLLTQLSASGAQAGKRFRAVLLVDLDDFKLVNDTLGHAMGDAVLVEVARRLRSLATSSDVVLRLGGDEFVMLLGDDHPLETIHELVHQVRATLTQPYSVVSRLKASVGLAIVDDPAQPPELEALIEQADQEMYRAKRQGAEPAPGEAQRA